MVHAIDLRGHGASDWPGTYSIDLMAQDVAALLPQLHERPDLVGHSLGGLVACRVAAGTTPVRRLVLEDVGLLRPRPAATPTRPAGDLDVDWAVVEQVRPEIDVPAPDWSDVLVRITVPTLAISGGPSSFLPPAHVRELTELVADSTLVTIDAGHLLHASRPDDFIRATREHLNRP